jgi:hypothetical protein
MTHGFRTSRLRWLAWISLGWLAMVGAAAQAADPKYLAVVATFVGKGEVPMTSDDVSGAKQEWTLGHSYVGRIEVAIQVIETSPAPNRRTKWIISPAAGGGRLNRIYGFIRDKAMNGYRESGEGGSSAEHDGDEVWSAGGFVNGEELGLQLTIEPEAGTWGAKFAPGAAEEILSEQISYQGKGKRKPGNNGFGKAWQFLTGDPKETGWLPSGGDEEQRSVYSGYHPRGSVTLVGEIAAQNLLPGGTNYAGVSPIPVPAQLPGKGSIQLYLSWVLLDALPEVELVVRSPRYWKWLPTLQPDGRPGERLGFVARLESPKGEDLSGIQCESIRWTLVDTSREPGESMNVPITAMELDPGDPDLRIEGVPTESDEQVGNEPEPEYGQSEIEIVPDDWGGWSVLRVEAKLKDGRVLKGRLETPPDAEGEHDIRLPLREPQSKIGRVWLQQEGVSDQADADDDDRSPEGRPGFNGDGLTLYQEYRGFQVKGSHVRTNPRVKDLFIQNRTRALAEPAIQTFANLSGLKVHLPSFAEFDPERGSFEINRNRMDGPSRGPQAGLLVQVGGDRRPNDEIPPGTRPGSHIPILVPEFLGLLEQGGVSAEKARDHFVVQALFQSVAVERPGPTDSIRRFLLKTQPPGSAEPPRFVLQKSRLDTNGEPVVVLDLAGGDLAQLWNLKMQRELERELRKIPPNLSESRRAAYESVARRNRTLFAWVVGERGGAHSGPEECLMRDWFAEAHESEFTGPGGIPVFRYIDPEARREKPGRVLGATRAGTGINATSNRPESRYGSRSAPGQANQQLLVNDNP